VRRAAEHEVRRALPKRQGQVDPLPLSDLDFEVVIDTRKLAAHADRELAFAVA